MFFPAKLLKIVDIRRLRFVLLSLYKGWRFGATLDVISKHNL
jgi:hypothetical protein